MIKVIGSVQRIIQGSNAPLIMEVEDTSSLVKISAMLIRNKTMIKTWSETDITIKDNALLFPLTEKETLSMEKGAIDFELKALNDKNEVIIYDIIHCCVIERQNDIILGGN